MSFIPLHVNSTYSFLRSALSVDKLINKCQIEKINAVALTDFNSLIGSVQFFKKCEQSKIKPILGLDLLVDNLLLTFLVKDETGYQNLLYLSQLFNLEKLTLKSITNHADGLICVMSTNENKLLDKFDELGDTKFAYFLKSYADVFKDFYIGLEIYQKEEKSHFKTFKEFLKKRDYPLLAFPFIRYEKKEDEIIYQIVQAIKNETKLDEHHQKADGVNYFYSINEINELYEEEEINNTSKLANEINFSLIKKRGKLIHFTKNSDTLLKEETYRLLKEKNLFNEEYQKRLDYELDVIKSMGYSDYFLIVADYVKFAKDHGIYVGPGRGSAGGSLVAYALNIITIDPIKANLIFERFLNSGRKSMPDIDVDFEDTRREEVVNYLREKYGVNRVGNILTCQTLKAKAAIRDIGRVYSVKDSYIDILCKATGGYDDLHDAYRYMPTFRQIVNSDKYYLFIVTMASKIEGIPRQAGMHAAGVIINDEPLETSLPVYLDGNHNYLSQLEKDDLEALGYLKMDILGLRNLSIVKSIITDAKNITYDQLPYDDKDAIKLIATGQTIGLFQLESKGMIRTIKEMNPTTFEDVVSLIALYRPGPMKFIPQFIARKEGKEKITYPSQKLIDILKPTYGIIVYQEQIMQIARAMAGFSYQEADSFRRAISKKDANILANLKTAFINGSLKSGNKQKESEEVFNLIYRFANYGFNRSHAYAYAKLASQMAYLKLHYPAYFYSAVLDNGNRFSDVIAEIRSRKINIRLPDINKASFRYHAIDNDLYIPLISIKGILSQAVLNIIKEREENGEYKSFVDFVVRNAKYKISSSTITKLIDSGSFDNFNHTRAGLRDALTRVMDFARLNLNQGNQLLLDNSFIPMPRIENIKDDDVYNVTHEYENLGIALSKSPLDFYQDEIKKEKALPISEAKNKTYAKIVGMIKSVRRIKTKKDHKTMAFVTISDNIDDISVTIFNDLYNRHEAALYSAKILIVTGRYDPKRDEFVAKEIKAL
ncbi:MAG: DNA polymerase III subunit alpha [Bacilli bacterium]|nr:DNA polymerase III subunit alpha [Bacilli bacterium]